MHLPRTPSASYRYESSLLSVRALSLFLAAAVGNAPQTPSASYRYDTMLLSVTDPSACLLLLACNGRRCAVYPEGTILSQDSQTDNTRQLVDFANGAGNDPSLQSMLCPSCQCLRTSVTKASEPEWSCLFEEAILQGQTFDALPGSRWIFAVLSACYS